jgi:hypothetical protein
VTKILGLGVEVRLAFSGFLFDNREWP